MIFISHRGNINGIEPENENSPSYLDLAFEKGYEVECDIWYIDGNLFLGHDEPQYEIDITWLLKRKDKIWIHCKNVECVSYLSKLNSDLNYFFHEHDKLTLTSNKNIWVYPGNQPIENSIAVLPEIHKDDITKCKGICSDFVGEYKTNFII